MASSSNILSFEEITALLRAEGFLFLPRLQAEALLEDEGLKNWSSFSHSWDDLGLDQYMADGGSYRRRRYGVFSISEGEITRKPHQPHYQSRDYNLLNGGVERWFSPIEDMTAQHPAMQAILKMGACFADALTPPERRPKAWHTEVHQFRIEAQAKSQGLPTPEGMHRDGVDWVFVVMIRRENIAEGTTSIYAPDQKTMLGSFTLAEPLDCAVVDDHRVFHGVTPVRPEDSTKPAWRDVLVVTLRHE